MAKSADGIKILADNRQAGHNYHLLDRFEAGIALTGTEVKAAREGRVQLKDNYAEVTGNEAWLAFTGGDVRLPPTISKGRALAGSGDGWVYALDAGSGRQIWRFRAAPMERRIPIYGTLQSTWPAASGVVAPNWAGPEKRALPK